MTLPKRMNRGVPSVRRSSGECALDVLTPREREVLGLMAQGMSNTAIHRELMISHGAVEKHIRSIFAKLQLNTHGGQRHRRVLAVLTYLRA
ncbi:DNA-binding NarL/FixJ family response regulator [Nocardiopsis mwathae]|uniref:DNA-binding NarL/FixJ family response regulator n=1 Tax=Nocardiopsis mwathae TaxID=1472723 RepID=A0A7W9YGM7_9ACTN|nr:DNA-binding NarL/FixJ family response regulator [Nocardiopsis mwathae]